MQDNSFATPKGKPISNPMLVGAIELLKAENTPEHQKLFTEEMLKAKYLAPVIIDPVPVPDEKGLVKIPRDARIQFPMLTTKDGKHFMMAFTDWEELHKWKDEPNQQTFALSFDDYARMLLKKGPEGQTSSALGFVINPFGGNIVVTNQMVAGLIAQRLKAAAASKAAKEGRPAGVGSPATPDAQN